MDEDYRSLQVLLLRIASRLREERPGPLRFSAFIYVCFAVSQNFWGGPNVEVFQHAVTHDLEEDIEDTAIILESIAGDDPGLTIYAVSMYTVFFHCMTALDFAVFAP